MENYTLTEVIGKAAQTTVYLAECQIDQKQYVLKKVECFDESEANKAFREALELQNLQHPYISGFIEFFVTWDKEDSSMFICFVMDYFPNGNLSKVIERHRETKDVIGEQAIKEWLGQILGALLYIHDENVPHRDLKPSNIYIKEDDKLCLGDFGVATIMGDARTCTRATVGLLNYLPPEAHVCVYDQCSDVWALGCVLFELVTTWMLDADQCDQKLMEIKQDTGVLEVVFEDIAQHYSGELISVMRKMLKRNLDPNSTEKPRETVKELQSEKYIKSCVELTIPCQVEKRLRQKSARSQPRQIPKDQGVVTVLEYMATMVDFESAVQQSLEYLLELSKEEGGIEMNASGKRLIAVAMKNNTLDKKIQIMGCKLFNYLVIGIDQTDVVYAKEVIAVVMEAMGVHPDSAELQQTASALLIALSNSDRAAADIGELGGVHYVLDALEKYKTEPELCAIFCSALWNLTVNEQNIMIATENKGVYHVCEALKTHMNSVEVIEAASAALLSLSLEVDKIEETAVADVCAVKLNMTDDERCKALKKLHPRFVHPTRKDENIKYTGELNAVGLLLCAVETHIKNPKVVKNACLALASLVETDEESAYRVLTNTGPDGKHVAGIPIAIKAYEHHKDNAEVVESIVTLFMELTDKDEEEISKDLQSFHAINYLKEIKLKFFKNEDIMEPCEKAIENLMKTKLGNAIPT